MKDSGDNKIMNESGDDKTILQSPQPAQGGAKSK